MLHTNRERILLATSRPASGIVKPAWYEHFVENKEQYYRTFHIPKRELARAMRRGLKLWYPRDRIPESELSKWRQISAPIECLREAQEELVTALYKRRASKFDFCIRKRNRHQAIEALAGKRIVIAADIKDAFPSTKKRKIQHVLRREKFTDRDIEIISELGTFQGCLPQGSPCSPVLLNLCRKALDYRLNGIISKHRRNGGLVVYVDNYYFYSDDPEMNNDIPIYKSVARREGYELPDKKIYVMRKGSRQGGLGLVASVRGDGTTCVQPPRKERRRMKAILRNGVTRKREGQEPWPDLTIDVVRGMVECFKGSVHYMPFLHVLHEIEGRIHDSDAVFSPWAASMIAQGE